MSINYFFLLCVTVFILINGKPHLETTAFSNINATAGNNKRLDKVNSNDQTFSMRILLSGSLGELKLVSRDVILKSLWAIEKFQVPLERQQIIWKILKGDRSPRALTRFELELCGDMLIHISEYDLYNLNISDWGIVDFLGTYEGFSRRKTGIIAYALVNYYSNEELLEQSEKINKFKGLICGFSPSKLNTISPSVFTKLSAEVFAHIYSCTSRQLTVLLEDAMRMTTYGPPQAWNASDVKKLGLIVRGLNLEMLSKLRPESIAGIHEETITRMSPQQLQHLSNEQVQHLSSPALSAYRRIIGLPSFASRACKSNTIFIVSCIIIKIIQFN